MPSKKLKGKTALVTGASKRIGREISLALAQEGVNVAIHYCSSKRDAQKLRAELIDIGVNSWVVGADFEKTKECNSLIERTLKLTGSLDILINNASVFLPDTLRRMDYEALFRHIQVNDYPTSIRFHGIDSIQGDVKEYLLELVRYSFYLKAGKQTGIGRGHFPLDVSFTEVAY